MRRKSEIRIGGKAKRRFIALSIPGRTEADAATWFVFDCDTFRSEEAANYDDAKKRAAAREATRQVNE